MHGPFPPIGLSRSNDASSAAQLANDPTADLIGSYQYDQQQQQQQQQQRQVDDVISYDQIRSYDHNAGRLPFSILADLYLNY